MREWSERHIRDLVRSEYNKLGGGGSDDYQLTQKRINTFIEQYVMTVRSWLSGYDIRSASYYYYGGNVFPYPRIHFSDVSVELFQVPILTDEQRQSINWATLLGDSEFAHVNGNNYLNYIMGRYFIKININGYFHHYFLGNHSNVNGFGNMQIAPNQTSTYSGYYYPWENDYEALALPYIDPEENPKIGTLFHDTFKFPPMTISLDAILPTLDPRYPDRVGYHPINSSMYMGICDRFLIDKNNTNRFLRFSYIKGFTTPFVQDGFSVEWWKQSQNWRDYENDTLYFEFETFLGSQVEYTYYKKVDEFLNL